MQNIEPSKLRKYLYEYALIALACCVIYLFFALDSLNGFIRGQLIDQKTEAVKAIEQNTEALRQFIEAEKNHIYLNNKKQLE